MSLFLSNRDGGLTDEQGHYRFQTNVWSGHVIGDGLQVTQNSPLGMSVIVGEGDARVPYAGYAYTAWNDANEVVNISTANPSNPRIDRLVMYIDRGDTPQQVNPNNPGIPKFAVVAGTPAAVPVRPSDSAVDSAVGASNPWIDLADVTVNAGVTQITNSNITDTRLPVSITRPVSFLATMTGTQSVTPSTFTKINYSSEVYDHGGNYDPTTQQFTAPVDGIYNFGACIVRTNGFSNVYRHLITIFVDGSEAVRMSQGEKGGINQTFSIDGHAELQLTAGQVVEARMWHAVVGSQSYGSTNTYENWFYGRLVGSI